MADQNQEEWGNDKTVHLYIRRNDNGEPVEWISDVDGREWSTNILDFRNLGERAIDGWKISFNCPGLELDPNQFWNGVIIEQNGDRFVLASIPENAQIAPGETLKKKIVFNSPKINGAVPIVENFKIQQNQSAPENKQKVHTYIKRDRQGQLIEWVNNIDGQEWSANILDFRYHGPTINGWKISFNCPGLKLEPNQLWNAVIIKQSDVHFVLGSTPANAKLADGESVSPRIAFNSPKINGAAPVLENFKIQRQTQNPDEWGNDSIVYLYIRRNENGEPVQWISDVDGREWSTNILDFRNLGEQAIDGWQVSFNCPGLELYPNQFWNGVIIEQNGDRFILASTPDNAQIAPGETLKKKIVFNSPKINGAVPIVENFKIIRFDYAKAIALNYLLFEANMLGKKASWNRVPWRDDACLNDGQKDKDGQDIGRDLTGGYADAGDLIKPNFACAINMSMLSLAGIYYRQVLEKIGQWSIHQRIVKWALDYFIKCHEMKDGKTERYWHWVSGTDWDHQVSVPAEETEAELAKRGWYRKSFVIDRSERGTEPCAATAAAWAFGAIMLQRDEPEYAAKLIRHAKAIYDFGDEEHVKYIHRYVYESVSGFYDELALGAIALYMATNEDYYLQKAENYFQQHIGNLSGWTWINDNSSYPCAFLLAKITGKDYYITLCQTAADWWLKGEGGVRISPDGLHSISDWGTIPQACATSFLLGWANDFIPQMKNSAYVDFAISQMDYSLGDNSRNFSFMIGFGDNYPKRPHHRGAYDGNDPNGDAKHVLHGALVAGPKANGEYNDSYFDWVTNEVGTAYNSSWLMNAVFVYSKTLM